MSMVPLPGLQQMIDSISQDRNLPKVAVQTALREALMKGYERYRRTQKMDTNFEEEFFDNFEVELDIEDEGFRVLAEKTIVETVDDLDHQIALFDVQEVAPEAQLGDTVVLDVTPDQSDFGRMAAIQTKQVLAQKLRDQQRKLVQEEFKDLEGEVLQATVRRFERQSVILSVNSGYGQPEQEAELPRREQLPNDNYRANATFRVVLKRVSEGSHRGPQLIVSRTDAGLVVDLFQTEVPEIEDDVVRIVAVAREANPPSRSVGPRTKIAVDTVERDVDPVGACIGARGSRIQAVVNELRGEKIDVIRWSPDPSTYIANALSPARVDEVRLMNPEERQAHVLVPNDQLSLAIGKEGQNVRLAARLTGWKIDIKDSGQYDYEAEDQKVADLQASWRQAAEAEAAAAADYDDDDYEDELEEDVDPAAIALDEGEDFAKVAPEAAVDAVANADLAGIEEEEAAAVPTDFDAGVVVTPVSDMMSVPDALVDAEIVEPKADPLEVEDLDVDEVDEVEAEAADLAQDDELDVEAELDPEPDAGELLTDVEADSDADDLTDAEE